MEKFTVTRKSGEFRLESGLNSEEMETFVKKNWDFGKDYTDSSEIFQTAQEAIARFEKLKAECYVTEYPCNRLMRVSWIELDEVDVDEDGGIDDLQTTDEYYPAAEDLFLTEEVERC